MTEVEDPVTGYEHHRGGAPVAAAAASDIWAVQSTGTGEQSVTWPEDGTWTVVVMNADGSAGIDVEADLQAEVPYLDDAAISLLAGAALAAVAWRGAAEEVAPPAPLSVLPSVRRRAWCCDRAGSG